MANSRLRLVNTDTGESIMLAKELGSGWYKHPNPESFRRFFNSLRGKDPYLYSETEDKPLYDYWFYTYATAGSIKDTEWFKTTKTNCHINEDSKISDFEPYTWYMKKTSIDVK